jgi:hypothetical protein
MTNPYVEIVKRIQPSGVDFVEFFAKDAEGLVSEEDGVLFDDDFEVRFISEYPAQGELESRGAAGLAEAWRNWLEPWRSYWLELEEVIDAGDNIVTFVRIEGRTRRDDVLVQHSPAAVWRFNDEGRIIALHFHLDRAEALEAAGLPSEEFAEKSE